MEVLCITCFSPTPVAWKSARTAPGLLSLGVGIVQVCALAEERGLRVINDLTGGLSSWMEYAGFKSIEDLKGAAYPAIIDFMDITAEKRIPATINSNSCIDCHKCEDCSYGAITLDSSSRTIKVDLVKCVGVLSMFYTHQFHIHSKTKKY